MTIHLPHWHKGDSNYWRIAWICIIFIHFLGLQLISWPSNKKNKTGKSTDFFFNTDHLEWTPCWDERGNLNSCLCFLHNCVCLFVLSGSNCFLCFPVFSTFECCMNSFVVSSSLVGLALLPWMTLVMKLMGWGDRFHVHPLHQSNVCVILLMFRYAVKV